MKTTKTFAYIVSVTFPREGNEYLGSLSIEREIREAIKKRFEFDKIKQVSVRPIKEDTD
jgi:hypothetical protein